MNDDQKSFFQKQVKQYIHRIAPTLQAGHEVNLHEFFGMMLMYATSASDEDKARILKISAAEVMKNQIRKYDA